MCSKKPRDLLEIAEWPTFPAKSMMRPPSIFLCLSGGGLRAAIFHYGCLKRLQEVGLLGHVYTTSATSGGAITAALLAQYSDVDEEMGIWTYKWEEFEQLLLHTALRGLLGRTTVLVIAYLIYIVASLATLFFMFGWLNVGWLPPTVFGIGLLFHLCLVGRLILDRAYTHFPIERRSVFSDDPVRPEISNNSVRRFIKMIFVPSYLRVETLNARLFHGAPLRFLPSYPRTFLNAVDLNDGRQKVFFKGGVAALDHTGTRRLWLDEYRWFDDDRIKYKNLTLAEAVAASSAIPLFFRPIALRDVGEPLGVFVDGGVADNLAINIPKAFSSFIHPSGGQRFQREAGGAAFSDVTSLVLIVDGSMPLVEKTKRHWTRLLSLKRISDAMMNQQVSDATITAFAFERNVQVPTRIISLQFGMPERAVGVPKLQNVLGKVRTHLDSFSMQECAVLAYCGYALIETLLQDEMPNLLTHYQGTRSAEFRKFNDILPRDLGTWDSAPEAIEREMRYANRRFLPLRWIGRTFGI